MFSEGKKAILMTDDSIITKKLELYLLQRYNLQLESTTNLIELLDRANDLDEPYEVAIVDEKVTGLPTTAKVILSIKDSTHIPNVFYLSTLHEMSNPSSPNHLEIPSDYFNDLFRREQSDLRLNNLRSMFNAVMESASIRDICINTAKSFIETLKVDSVVCVLSKYDTSTLEYGLVVCCLPEDNPDITNIPIKGHPYFDELLNYYKPIHVPDLFEEKEFLQVLLNKFSSIYRSVLIVPMLIGKNFLGYFGLFMNREPRVFNLTEIDQCMRLADFAASTSLNLFFSKMLKIHSKEESNPD